MGRPGIRAIIGVIGLAWGLASETLYYRSGAEAPDVLRDLAIGWTYLFGGLAIWASRPANPTGRLMTLVGFTWFIGNLQLSELPVIDAIGTAFADVVFVCLIALILVYPTGHLETRLDRVTVVVLAVGTTINNAIRLLPWPPGIDIEPARLYVGVALASFAGIVGIRRSLVAPPRRRGETPARAHRRHHPDGGAHHEPRHRVVRRPGDPAGLPACRSRAGPGGDPLALLVGFYRQSELRQGALLDAIPDLMVRFNARWPRPRSPRRGFWVGPPAGGCARRYQDRGPPPARRRGEADRGRHRGARYRGDADPRPVARYADRSPCVRDTDHRERG